MHPLEIILKTLDTILDLLKALTEYDIVIINAIIEADKHGQLSPQTLKELKRLVRYNKK